MFVLIPWFVLFAFEMRGDRKCESLKNFVFQLFAHLACAMQMFARHGSGKTVICSSKNSIDGILMFL